MLQELTHPHLEKQRYQEILPALQLELMALQHGVFQQEKRVVIVFEGIDAAGKGGLIRRVTEFMDPRGYVVYPIGPPNSQELKEHYLQRFWRRLPSLGQTAFFDRSWYGRVLVERVDGLIAEDVWKRAYKEINQFEQQLIDDGIVLIKLFLSIDKDEQRRRFQERIETPRKRWKITADDLLNRQKWDDYAHAFDEMLSQTSEQDRIWHVIGANDKRHARIQGMETIRNTLNCHIDVQEIELLNPRVKELAETLLT